MFVCVRARARAHVCVCVCVRKREREGQRERESVCVCVCFDALRMKRCICKKKFLLEQMPNLGSKLKVTRSLDQASWPTVQKLQPLQLLL